MRAVSGGSAVRAVGQMLWLVGTCEVHGQVQWKILEDSRAGLGEICLC